MNKDKNLLQTRRLALIGIFTAIIIIMSLTPWLGFLQIGPIQGTTLHIPVIILAIVEGPVVGAILGFMFGLVSMIRAFMTPTAFSFMFMNPIVAIIPRILIGLFTGWLYQALKTKKGVKKLSIAISSAVGSITNTFFVLGLVYVIYGQKYMETVNSVGQANAQAAGETFVANTNALKLIATTAVTNGIGEMVLAVIISTPIAFALIRAFKKGRNM
ncbi:MAG: ECF transporter S component [Tissierellia bacterium]|nr:ECF transporter S component [Tissierellia bacterium]